MLMRLFSAWWLFISLMTAPLIRFSEHPVPPGEFDQVKDYAYVYFRKASGPCLAIVSPFNVLFKAVKSIWVWTPPYTEPVSWPGRTLTARTVPKGRAVGPAPEKSHHVPVPPRPCHAGGISHTEAHVPVLGGQSLRPHS